MKRAVRIFLSMTIICFSGRKDAWQECVKCLSS